MSAFNGSGTFVISGVGLPFVTGTTISSTVANQLNTDLAAGLSTAICKDGQTTVTANIPLNSFKLTGVGAATGANDALTYAGAGNFAGMVGTTTNDSAVAGRIGEFVETVVQTIVPVSLATGVAKDMATISLTAGDWDVSASIISVPQSSTVTASIQAGINTTANTLPALELQQINGVISTPQSTASVALPRQRYSLASTTTVRAIVSIVFSAGTCSAAGFINARRVR